jgi:hypothetical protein
VREFKAPYALDEEGHVVAALTAPRHAPYSCLECGQRLVLIRLREQRPHFTHLADALLSCLGKSTTHLAAKRLLQEQVRQELEEHGGVVWHLRCAGVDGRCRDHATIPRRHVIQDWDAVELDVAHGSFRFDVAVTSQGSAVFGFEVVCAERKVPDAKAEATCVPWLKLLAEDVLAFRPRIPHGSLPPLRLRLRACKQSHRASNHRGPLAEERCELCKDLVARLAERKADDKARANTLAGTGADKAYRAEAGRVAGAWRAVLERARARP